MRDEDLQKVAKNDKTLTELDLSAGTGMRRNLERLAEGYERGRNTYLIDLTLTDNLLTDEDLKLVARLKNLQVLDVSENGKITNAGVRTLLTNLPQLHSLYLGGTGIDDEVIDALVESNLTVLVLQGTNLTDAGCIKFKRNHTITELNLDFTYVSDEIHDEIQAHIAANKAAKERQSHQRTNGVETPAEIVKPFYSQPHGGYKEDQKANGLADDLTHKAKQSNGHTPMQNGIPRK